MKVLTLKRLIGLAAVGGVAYVHKQRGGQWTVASITDTLKHLWSTAAARLSGRDRPEDTGGHTGHLHDQSARGPSASGYRAAPYASGGKREDEGGRH
jgi:hypothetical protein